MSKSSSASKIERSARLRWVSLGKMYVSPVAQRDLVQAHVDHLLAEFDPELIGNPHVSQRSDRYYIIDGQHRIEALKAWLGEGHEAQQVQCWTYVDLTEADEANLFDRLNDVRQVNAFDKFRIRVNAGRDRKGPLAVFRVIPAKVVTAEEMGISREVQQLCQLTKGLVLVTGPTGSGKSTTLCALIDLVNRTRSDHIITIEDPIEFVHENKKCLINQRQVGEHTDSFKDALRAALREDPDIVLVGEMRDLETVSIAIETAETGHLVFGTLHTSSAASTVDRIIDQFPAERQEQIRTMLASSLKGVISQVLCRKIGGGRVPAMEVMIGTTMIIRIKTAASMLTPYGAP